MKQNNEVAEQIIEIGESSFAKLKKLNIPPYPKYYFDTFMDQLDSSGNESLIILSKKFSHLFTINDINTHHSEVSFEVAKNSLNEFKRSNLNLKEISDKNIIDISAIRSEDDRVHGKEVMEVFDEFQKQVVNELASADRTITQLKLQIEKLEKESHVDPLTKAYNRRVLSKDLEEIINGIEDKATDMHVVIIDADDFKVINDSFGHLAGDKTLIFLVKLLQSSIRKGTRIYRYGGEEFIIVLNRVALDEAEKTVARFIQETDESKLLYKGKNIHLTISAGITKYKKGDTVDSLIERADKALYEAKSSGKNCYKVNS